MKQPKWTHQQLNAAATLADEIMKTAPTDQTVEQHMKDILAARVEGVDAGQQVSELCAGIDLFHQTLKQAEQKGLSTMVREELDRLAAGCEEQELADRLHSLLCACAQATGQPAPEAAGPDQIPALRAAVCEYFSEYALLCTNNAALVELAQAIGTDRLEILQRAEDQTRCERYIALALYIQNATGMLEGIPAELSAKEIGVSVASALSTEKTLRDGMSGAIDVSTMKAKLKLIAGAALLSLLIIVAAKLTLAFGALTFLFVQSIVGLGIIGTVTAVLLAVLAGKRIVDAAAEVSDRIASVTGVDQIVDLALSKVKDWYHDTLLPAAQSFWQRIRTLLHRAETAEPSAVQAKTAVHTADETTPVQA